jgi:FMN phosphatase YigB (HAD superfamily)
MRPYAVLRQSDTKPKSRGNSHGGTVRSVPMTATIEALTFDWYGTLATHRDKGRRRLFIEYLASHDMQSAPWDRRVLYDVFAYYGQVYRPQFSDDQKLIFWAEFTRQLFECFQVRGSTADQSELHAAAIRDIFGPRCFQLYPDVLPVLYALKRNGFRLAVISNWHRGLDLFCFEMNLSDLFDVVISSADIGIEKPDSRIFNEAVRDLTSNRIGSHTLETYWMMISAAQSRLVSKQS